MNNNTQMIEEQDKESSRQEEFDVIIFDIGGILVEADVIATLQGSDKSVPELWSHWLSSPAVRSFESGKSGTDEFADLVIAELSLPIDRATFIEAFGMTARKLYDGAEDLLLELSERFTIACLSNTNEIHWSYLRDSVGLSRYFDHSFVSHELGLLKPDRDIFEAVIERLGVPPERILFFDDNMINIEGAIPTGIHALRVDGVEGVRGELKRLGVV